MRSIKVRRLLRLPSNPTPPDRAPGGVSDEIILTGPFHYVVTGPVARFARQIAGQGYIVAAPSSYHDFTGPEPLAYDVPGTDRGNEWKVAKVGNYPCDGPHQAS